MQEVREIPPFEFSAELLSAVCYPHHGFNVSTEHLGWTKESNLKPCTEIKKEKKKTDLRMP